MREYLFTSESVSEGHPDKVADQISDGVLDAFLEQDPKSRVAAETMISTGLVVVSGEISSNGHPDITSVIKKVVNDIGYNSPEVGFDCNTCSILTSIDKQSPDIALGVNSSNTKEQGAGDQGLMFGYACDETKELMPLSILLSHQLVQELSAVRKSKKLDFLRPDSKSQVTLKYVDGKVKGIESVVISTQHNENVTLSELKEAVMEEVVKKIIPSQLLDQNTKYFINPTGRFVVGGPQGDCGLTGRKIIVDTYGGHGAHGGGAFSGKDPSKVDRSAAYATRHIAKNIVAAGFAQKCLVQVAYAIGVAQPVSVMVNDYGTATCDISKLENAILKAWDLRPSAIVEEFDLLSPGYLKTAAYGHFGREIFTWEKVNKVERLKSFM